MKIEYQTADGSKDDGHYMNPLLGATSFFEGAEVQLNGTRLDQDLFGQNMFQILNRSFTTKRIRKLYTDNEHEMLPVTGVTAALVNEQPGYKAGRQLLNSGSTDVAKANYRGYRCSIDGCFLLSAPKSLSLMSLAESKGVDIGEDVKNYTLIRPGTHVIVRLNKARPLGKNLGNYKAHEGSYCKEAALKADDSKTKMWRDPVINIRSINLLYEVLSYASLTPEQIMGKIYKYNRDRYRIQVETLDSGTRMDNTTFTFSDTTKMCYILYPWQFQVVSILFLKSRGEKTRNLPSRCTLIPPRARGRRRCGSIHPTWTASPSD